MLEFQGRNGGGDEDKNRKNRSVLRQSIDNPNLYNISKSQTPKPIKRRDREDLLLTLKKCYSSLIFSPNWAVKLKFGM